MELSIAWRGARRPPIQFRVGACPICHTSVLVDDEFVRVRGRPRHVECDRFAHRNDVRERIELRSTAEAAGKARDWVASLVPGIQPEAQLLLTELVTNAVRHPGPGCDTVAVTFDSSLERLRIGVSDSGCGFEWHSWSARMPADEGGYGLIMVDRLATRWAIENGANGTTVWFELERGQRA